MTDPILVFPRVIIKDSIPSFEDNDARGYIEGNIWVNNVTGKSYICVDRREGRWVEIVTSGTGSGISFDIAPENLLINAGNIRLNDTGFLDLTGEALHINVDATDPPTQSCYYGVYRGENEPVAKLRWNEDNNRWEAGFVGYNWPIVTSVIETRNPLPTDYEEYFVGQTWINLVTQQKFTCVSRMGGVATWRMMLTVAPTTYTVEPDDYIVFYGNDDGTFTKMHWDQFILWIKYSLDLADTPTIPEYGFQLDGVGNIMPSEEDPVTNGIFELDANGDLMPRVTPEDDPSDPYYELDGNDDVQLKII